MKVAYPLTLDMEQKIWSMIDAGKFLVAVTGAGISRASGLPLLRQKVGGIALSQIFRAELFRSNPVEFYRVYRKLLGSWRTAKPNEAHMALVRRGVWVVTQNIDGLHRDAGTEHLIELHGNLRELRCESCEGIYGSGLAMEALLPLCPQCQEVLHPGISLEGEEIRHFSRAADWAGRADVMLVVGTSLSMDPVRRLPAIAAQNGARVIWVNSNAEYLLPRLLKHQTN